MATDNNIKIYTVADIEKYHKGQLSPQERHGLEKAALDDPFLADALEGYAVAGVNATADLAELKKRLAQKTGGAKVIPLEQGKKERKAIPWMKIAAMLVILVGAGILANRFLLTNNKKEIAQINSKVEEIKATDSTAPVATTPVTGRASRVITGDIKDPNPTIGNGNTKPVTATKDGSTTTTTVTDNVKTTEVTALDTKPKDDVTIKEVNEKNVAPIKKIVNEGKEDLAKENTKNKTAPAVKREADKNLVVTRTEVPSGDKQKYYNESTGAVTSRKAENNQYRANIFRGYVTDNNNRGVPFANVTNVRDNVGTYTDASGNFILTSTDSVLDVQVRSVGLETNVVRLRNDAPANQVVLQEERSEVVVNNLGSKKPNAELRQQNANIKLEEPEPADGWDNYDVYLVNNLNVPSDFKTKQDGTGEVKVSFEVDKNGEPTKIRIEKSLCKTCDKEAIRLVKDGPKWKQKAKKGRTTVTITF